MADKLPKLPFPNDPSVTKEQNKTNQLLERRHYDVSIILPAPPRRKRCGLARWRRPTPGNLLAVDEHDDFQASISFARACVSAITDDSILGNKNDRNVDTRKLHPDEKSAIVPSFQDSIDAKMIKKSRGANAKLLDASSRSTDTTCASTLPSTVAMSTSSSLFPSSYSSPISVRPYISNSIATTRSNCTQTDCNTTAMMHPPPPPIRTLKKTMHTPPPGVAATNTNTLSRPGRRCIDNRVPFSSSFTGPSNSRSGKIRSSFRKKPSTNPAKELSMSSQLTLYPPPPKRQPLRVGAIASEAAMNASKIKASPTSQKRAQKLRVGKETNPEEPIKTSRSSLTISKMNCSKDVASNSQEIPYLPKCKSTQDIPATPNHISTKSNEEQIRDARFDGSRPDYRLGDSARSTSHMVIAPPESKKAALDTVASLADHDFAFVKRSDGSFTYSILAFRRSITYSGQDETKSPEEEWMIFALDSKGSTKNLRRSRWNEYVRLVSPKQKGSPVPSRDASSSGGDDQSDDSSDKKFDHEVEDDINKRRREFYRCRGSAIMGDDWVPQENVSFDMAEDDLISCISAFP